MQASKIFSKPITLLLPALLLLPWQSPLGQGVPIVEAAGAGSRNQAAQQPAGGNAQNDIVVNMYLQLEQLQTEVQNLRGLVEEQSYQLRRMQTEQRDRYLDTDSRLVELQNEVRAGGSPRAQQLSQSPGGGPAPQSSQGNPAAVTPAAGGGQGQTPAVDPNIPRTEQDIYRQALALLLEQEEYQDSITLFQQYIDVYPQGRYFTNALYWQGAALELTGDYNRAIDVLQRLIDNYPADAKAPTAMLRLGTVYREMGRTPDAVAMWRQISEKYPNATSELEIARDYLNDASQF